MSIAVSVSNRGGQLARVIGCVECGTTAPKTVPEGWRFEKALSPEDRRSAADHQRLSERSLKTALNQKELRHVAFQQIDPARRHEFMRPGIALLHSCRPV